MNSVTAFYRFICSKMHRSVLSVLLIILVLMSAPVNAQFSGGDGTEANPYLVATASDLNQVRNHLSAHFRQVSDINLSGQSWSAIGSSHVNERFSGVYDGGGNRILGLTLQRPNEHYQGLFGYISGGSVKNLHLQNVSIQARSYAGALVGYATQCVMENVSVSATNVSGYMYVGGLAGWLYACQVRSAESDGVVSGYQTVGGLAGITQSTTLRYGSARGQVLGSHSYVGGLLGQQQSGATFDSFSHAQVSGGNIVGGLIAMAYGGGAAIVKSYSAGSIDSEGDALGGLIAQRVALYGVPVVVDSFWNQETAGVNNSDGGVAKSTLQMQQAETFINFNFRTVWSMQGESYPTFQSLRQYSQPERVLLESLQGQGTAESPYLIYTAGELNAMRMNPSAHYQLMNEINLIDSVVWEYGAGWLPIGSSDAPFVGVLDGAGHAIRNLVINRPTSHVQGLLGQTAEGAVVTNLSVLDANVYGGDEVGILVGRAVGVDIDRAVVSGEVSGRNQVGGVSGRIYSNSRLVYVGSDVSAKGFNHVGGFAGVTHNISMIYTYSQGAVRGDQNVGGLLGQLQGGLTADSYSSSDVKGLQQVGGLMGSTYGGGSLVFRTYSNGSVMGDPAHSETTGGLIGTRIALYGVGEVEDSYWDIEKSGQVESSMGIGRSSAEMSMAETFQRFNFNLVWMLPDQMNASPVFQDLSVYTHPEERSLSDLSGSGTRLDPYLIHNRHELNAMRLNVNAHYRLMANIDLADSVVWNMGEGWLPVGTQEQMFVGSFDGNGFALENLVINRPGKNDQGLFGRTNEGAELSRVSLKSVNVYGSSYTGALVGRANATVIHRVRVEGDLSGRHSVGGIAGEMTQNVSVANVRSQVRVRGYNYIGGLVGNSGSTHVRMAFSTGELSGAAYVGGLQGMQSGGLTEDSYSHARVRGAGYIGGLLGSINSGSAQLRRAYSAGQVLALNEASVQVGGLVGASGCFYGCPVVSDSYWDTESSTVSVSAGGTGYSTAAMTWPYAQGVYQGWDFSKTWRNDVKQAAQGYPYLRDPDQQRSRRGGLPVWLLIQ
ncbi:ZmpA/ZmpB/ZmpC family metallo-endopeptidase-related protein [Nitrincola nitratireducens]|uniref:Immunoglobulin A1 protease n=1 Tax=Nitrincola nitratireducens TaxID=1229521 RepID=W9UXJ7_9GAMM|nr:ZmpA/ZmpB/ZmpC family metallo-endopeptidase-related protein [Nitrincola nitratireducens]EXJ11799.1 Immunoglobulin A1 protease precursor [Nitrincola nitratireducens]